MKKNKLILSLLACFLSQGGFSMTNGTYVGVRANFAKPKAKEDLSIGGNVWNAQKSAAAIAVTHNAFGCKDPGLAKLVYERSKNFSLVFGHLVDLHEKFGAGMECEFSGWYAKVSNNGNAASLQNMGFTQRDIFEMFGNQGLAADPWDALISPKDIKGGSIMANLYGEVYILEWNNLMASFCIGGGLGGYVNVLRVSEFTTESYIPARGMTYRNSGTKGLTTGGIAYQFMLMGRVSWESLMAEFGYKFMNTATECTSNYRGRNVKGVAVKNSGAFLGIFWRF